MWNYIISNDRVHLQHKDKRLFMLLNFLCCLLTYFYKSTIRCIEKRKERTLAMLVGVVAPHCNIISGVDNKVPQLHNDSQSLLTIKNEVAVYQ